MSQVFHIVTSVKQLARNGFQTTVIRQAFVAHHITDLGQADQYTATVFITQTAFHVIHRKQFIIDLTGILRCVRQLINKIFFLHDYLFYEVTIKI